jgi:hypothetical protein
MKSHRIFAFATSVVAITLAEKPISAAALTRNAGGSPVKYMTISAAGSPSSVGTVIEVISMVFDHLGHPPPR